MSGFFGGGGSGASFSQLSFGANLVSNLVAVYLYPGNEVEQAAQITEFYQAVRVPEGKTATLALLRVTAGQAPIGAGSTITVRKRSPGVGGAGAGVDTALLVELAAGVFLASNDADTIVLLDGDEISVQVAPDVGQTNGPATGVIATMLITYQ